jgi:hypothetical protein
LTPEKAEELREDRASLTYREITEKFGISRQAAINIVKGRTHRAEVAAE